MMFNVFIRFLKDNNWYTQYQRNVKKELLNIKKDNKQYYISGAFMWSETKEGQDFWGDVHRNWIIKLLENAN